MMEPYLPSLSIGLTNQMLHLFGKSGKVEAMMKVLIRLAHILFHKIKQEEFITKLFEHVAVIL